MSNKAGNKGSLRGGERSECQLKLGSSGLLFSFPLLSSLLHLPTHPSPLVPRLWLHDPMCIKQPSRAAGP